MWCWQGQSNLSKRWLLGEKKKKKKLVRWVGASPPTVVGLGVGSMWCQLFKRHTWSCSSYLTCPTYSAQSGACLSRNWLCSSQTLWARSSEKCRISLALLAEERAGVYTETDLRRLRLMWISHLKWCSKQNNGRYISQGSQCKSLWVCFRNTVMLEQRKTTP